MSTTERFNDPRQDTIIIGVLTLPFFLNDFANIFVTDYRVWLAIDYVFVKVFPLAVILYLLRTKRRSLSDFGIRRIRFGPFLNWTGAMTFLGILFDQFGSRLFVRLLPDTRLGGMPAITDPLINQVDLSLGLAVVGLVEEVIFRGLFFTVLSAHFRSAVVPFLIPTLVFGLIHWSLGVSAIAHTAIIGILFMICMAKTGSVLPTIVAHFFVNYVAFSGVLNP